MRLICFIYGLGIDEPLVMKRGGQESYYHMNHLGSVTHITDKQGAVVEQYSYDVYGRATILDKDYEPQANSAVGNIYYFTGRQLDFETGIYYYRARYYDAVVGRFLQRDPAEDDVLLNLYAYVGNQPINFTDPFGLVTTKYKAAFMKPRIYGENPDNTREFRDSDRRSSSKDKILFKWSDELLGNCATLIKASVGETPIIYVLLGFYPKNDEKRATSISNIRRSLEEPFTSRGYNIKIVKHTSSIDVRFAIEDKNMAGILVAGHGWLNEISQKRKKLPVFNFINKFTYESAIKMADNNDYLYASDIRLWTPKNKKFLFAAFWACSTGGAKRADNGAQYTFEDSVKGSAAIINSMYGVATGSSVHFLEYFWNGFRKAGGTDIIPNARGRGSVETVPGSARNLWPGSQAKTP